MPVAKISCLLLGKLFKVSSLEFTICAICGTSTKCQYDKRLHTSKVRPKGERPTTPTKTKTRSQASSKNKTATKMGMATIWIVEALWEQEWICVNN